MRVLLVHVAAEPCAVIARSIEAALIAEGHSVDRTVDDGDVERLADSNGYDVIAIRLAGAQSLELVRRLRERHPSVRVLALAADREAGLRALEVAADDYVTRPISDSLVLEHVRALAGGTAPRARILRFADLEIHAAAHLVTRGGREVPVTPKQFALLQALLRHRGSAVTYEQLVDEVWQLSNCSPELKLEIDRRMKELTELLHRYGPEKLVSQTADGYAIGAASGGG